LFYCKGSPFLAALMYVHYVVCCVFAKWTTGCPKN